MKSTTNPSGGLVALCLFTIVAPVFWAACAGGSEPQRAIRPVEKTEYRIDPSAAAQSSSILNMATISADGTRAILASADKHIYEWVFAAPQSRRRFPESFSNERHFFNVDLSDNNQWLVSASPFLSLYRERGSLWVGGLVRVWDFNTGFEVLRFVGEERIESIKVSKNKRWISFFDDRANFGRIDLDVDRPVVVKAAALIAGLEPSRGRAAATSVGISADGSWAYRLEPLSNQDDAVAFYDMNQRRSSLIPLRDAALASADISRADSGKFARAQASCISPDDRVILLQPAGEFSELYQFEPATGRFFRRLNTGITTPIRRFATLESPARLLTATDSGVTVFDMDGGSLIFEYAFPAKTSLVAAGLTASDLVLLCSEDGPRDANSPIKPLDRLVATVFRLK